MQGGRKLVKVIEEKKKVQEEQQEEQEETVVFRLQRPIEQSPHQQLIVSRLPKKRVKHNQTQEDEEEQLCQELMSKLSIKHSVQYFLKRVDERDLQRYSQVQQIVRENFIPKAHDIANRARFSSREAIMDKARGFKIMDLQANFVELGGKKVQIEDFGQVSQDYYILKKRTNFKQGTSIGLPQQAEKILHQVPFEEEDHTQMEQQHDEEDSNRQSNPDYEYPEEDDSYSSQNEGILADRSRNSSNFDEQDQEDVDLDQEELYRRYLRRCRKKDDSDDDMEFHQI